MRPTLLPAVLLFALSPALDARQPPAAAAAPDVLDVAAFDEEDDETIADESEGDDELQNDLAAGRRELEELLRAEDAHIHDEFPGPKNAHRLGAANPLRMRTLDDPAGVGAAHPFAALGDAGELLSELGGVDLAQLASRYDIPVELNDAVLEYVAFFKGPGRKWFERWLARSHRWIPFMRPILADEGVPLDLVYLAMIESGFSAFAYSWASASGFWQFISSTGRHYGLRDDFWVDERRDPELSTRAAARFLRDLHREFGDWYLAWGAYNAGPGKIRRAIRMYETRDFWEMSAAGPYLKKETRHYVPKLIAAAIIAKHPERFGFSVEPEGAYEYDEVEVPDATDLAVIARSAGVSVEAVQALNPALRRGCTPPARNGKGYAVRLPAGTSERFAQAFAEVKPSERLTFRHHRVVKGDTMSAIARRFGMPAEPIMKLNGIKDARRLRLGMDLVIPLPTQLAAAYPDRPAPAAKASKASKASARAAPKPAAQAKRGTYVIRSGDTLWSIAQRFGVAVDELRRWNGLGRDAHRALRVGQALVVAPPAKNPARGRG